MWNLSEVKKREKPCGLPLYGSYAFELTPWAEFYRSRLFSGPAATAQGVHPAFCLAARATDWIGLKADSLEYLFVNAARICRHPSVGAMTANYNVIFCHYIYIIFHMDKIYFRENGFYNCYLSNK